jgi:selenophosphate synthase
MENDSAKLYWDKQIISNKTLEYNKPDIVLTDRKTNRGIIIDIAVPDSQNIQKTVSTKITKYQTSSQRTKENVEISRGYSCTSSSSSNWGNNKNT